MLLPIKTTEQGYHVYKHGEHRHYNHPGQSKLFLYLANKLFSYIFRWQSIYGSSRINGS
jgi:hypothetical protein